MAGVGTLRRGLGRGTRIAPLFKGKVGLPSAGLIKPGAGLGKPGPPAMSAAAPVPGMAPSLPPTGPPAVAPPASPEEQAIRQKLAGILAGRMGGGRR